MNQAGIRRCFPPLGKMEQVQQIARPPFIVKTRTRNPKYTRGLKYERKVSEKLDSLYGSDWEPGAWFWYQAAGMEKRKYCQVDGILTVGKRKILVECKYNHCPDAYFQLTNLYLPVVRFLFPKAEIALCEIVKWYDPDTAFPCSVVLLPRLHEAKGENFSVHILNK